MKELLVAVLLSGLACLGAADELYPRCTGAALSAKATGGAGASPKSLQVASDGGSGRQLLIECLAFEVISLSAAGVCEIPHQTMLPFRLYVAASGAYSDGRVYKGIFDVKDVVGGSINRLALTTPVSSTFELFFENESPNRDCLLAIRTIFTHAMPTVPPDSNLPSIVNLDPQTAYEGTPTTFVIKHTAVPEASCDLHLVPIESTCSGSTRKTELTRVTDAAVVAEYTAGYGEAAQYYSVWRSKSPGADNYKICAAPEAAATPLEIALLTVFGGNPMYFEVIAGAGPGGRIFTHTPITMRFHGYELDTRPDRDMAKLVSEVSTCDGAAAGGVPLATDLGPADSYGPNTVFTTWDFAIQIDGGYKVCYRRYGAAWTEIPSIDDLPPSAVSGPTTPAPPPPVPTNPRTHALCPLAKPRDTPPKYAQTYLKLTLSVPSVPSFLATLLSENLCVPRAALTFAWQSVSDSGAAVVHLDINCVGSMLCGSQDRKNFLLEAYAERLPAFTGLIDVVSVEEVSTKGIMTSNDHKGAEVMTKRTSVVVIVVCICLAVAVVAGVYGVVQFRKNQHHFIQFGIDEDDVDIDEPPRQADDFTNVPASSLA